MAKKKIRCKKRRVVISKQSTSAILKRSANHVCFAKRDSGLRNSGYPSSGSFEVIRENDATHEFFTNVGGEALFRSSLDIGLCDPPRIKAFDGKVRWSNLHTVVCVTGSWQVDEVCTKLGCCTPVEVRDAMQRRKDYVNENLTDAMSSVVVGRAKAGKGKNMPVGIISGLNLSATWALYLANNENLAAKRGGKPLTDDQLVAEMTAEFPDKAGKTTITRVSMVRGCYNKGTNMFKNIGEAGVKSLPYDEHGNSVDARRRGRKPKDSSAAPAKKKEGKKKATKNAVSKKATKKASKKKVSKKKASK